MICPEYAFKMCHNPLPSHSVNPKKSFSDLLNRMDYNSQGKLSPSICELSISSRFHELQTRIGIPPLLKRKRAQQSGLQNELSQINDLKGMACFACKALTCSIMEA